jgi:hypothetical protein
MGPFYCPLDRKVYLDTSFFEDMQRRFGACDTAKACQFSEAFMDDDLILVAAIGVDAKGDKQTLGLAEGATENAATVRSLIDNLVERGLNPAVPRLFIIDGAKAPAWRSDHERPSPRKHGIRFVNQDSGP